MTGNQKRLDEKKKKKEEKTASVSDGFGGFAYDAYVESDAVKAAKDKLASVTAGKPSAYTSVHQKELDDIMDKILNREKFHYDVNGDMLYNQYKDRYTENGKKAMEDTVGKAASLTGGYQNSYASTVGQQAYDREMQKVNDVIPELYQMAYDVYEKEGKQLQDRYAAKNAEEKAAYEKYKDMLAAWDRERAYAENAMEKEKDRDYGKYQKDRDLAYDAYVKTKKENYDRTRDEIADRKWQEEFDEAARRYAEKLAYEKERDAIADNRWQVEFEEEMRRRAEKERYEKERDEIADRFEKEKMDFEKQKYEDGRRKEGITKEVSAFEKAITGASDLYEAEKYAKALSAVNPRLANALLMNWLRDHGDKVQNEVDPHEMIVRDLPERKRDFYRRQMMDDYKKRYKK